MSTGEVLRVRAAMKPISHRAARARHRRRRTGRGGQGDPPALRRLRRARGRRRRRGDGRARARRRPCSRSSAATRWPRRRATTRHTSTASRRRCARGDAARPAPRGRRSIGPPGAGKTTVGAALADAARRPFHDTDAAIEAAAGRSHLRHLRRRRRARTSATSSAPRSRGALAERDGVVVARRRRRPWTRDTQAALAGHTGGLPRRRHRGRRAPDRLRRHRPLLLGQPAGPVDRADERAAPPPTSGWRPCRVDTAGRKPDEVVDGDRRRGSDAERATR